MSELTPVTAYELEVILTAFEKIEEQVIEMKDLLTQRIRYARGKRDPNPIIISTETDEIKEWFPNLSINGFPSA